MGLSFSVPASISIPPSLRQIFSEAQKGIKGFKIPKSGDLTNWARQGVLLLNLALTVKPGKTESHIKLWEKFTDKVIKEIIKYRPDTIFVLWGKKGTKFIKKL